MFYDSKYQESSMPSPSIVSLSLFLAVVACCIAGAVAAVAWTAPKEKRVVQGGMAAVALAVWVALTSAPVALGLVTVDTAVPGVPLMIGSMMLIVVAVALSSFGKRLSMGLPLAFLIGLQGLRFPLELVLHMWADEGVVPGQMTWTGQNIDIVAGLVCLVAAPFAARSRAVAWGSQVVGIVLLANVMRVVVLSVPTPLQSFPDPLLVAFYLPTQWIATVCVTGAVLVHILTVRKLMMGVEGE